MNRRGFIERTAATTVGVVSAIPAAGFTTVARTRATVDLGLEAAERRRHRFVNVPLQTQAGVAVRLYDDLLKDKTVLVNFMYTRCTEYCPLTLAKLARVQQSLGSRVGRDVFLYSITVDPEHDTPDVLRHHASMFDAAAGWLFLTGERADILAIRRTFGDDPTLEVQPLGSPEPDSVRDRAARAVGRVSRLERPGHDGPVSVVDRSEGRTAHVRR